MSEKTVFDERALAVPERDVPAAGLVAGGAVVGVCGKQGHEVGFATGNGSALEPDTLSAPDIGRRGGGELLHARAADSA